MAGFPRGAAASVPLRRQGDPSSSRERPLPGVIPFLQAVTSTTNGYRPTGIRSLLFPIRFPQSHKKGQPYGCPFLWPPVHRILPAKEKEEEEEERKKRRRERKNEQPDLHRPGSAFFRGTISSGNLATGSHPSSSIVKRVWEGWGELEGGREPFVRQPKGSLSPSKNIHPAAYPRASSAHNARRAASCSAFLQLVPVAVNCCPEGRETCTVKCRACSGPSQARVV